MSSSHAPHHQQVAREAALLTPISDQLAQVDRAYEGLFLQPAETAATSRAGVMAKVEVLSRLLNLENQTDAHNVLQSCQRDLERLWR